MRKKLKTREKNGNLEKSGNMVIWKNFEIEKKSKL